MNTPPGIHRLPARPAPAEWLDAADAPPAPARGSLWLMKAVDHWIGLPICFSLGVLVKLRHRFLPRKAQAVRENGTLVVTKFFGIGSIIEASTLLAEIRRRYPNGRLIFLTFQGNEALMRRLDLCTEVRVIRTGSPLTFVGDTLGHILWMRAQDVDALIDLELFSKFSTLISVLGGARMRIGYHLNHFWRSSLLTHPVYFNYYRHITEVFAQAGRRIDVTVPDRPLSPLPVLPKALAKVETTLEQWGIGGATRFVGVNVNAGELSLERRWPMGAFVVLIDRLLAAHPEVRIVLTGAPAEKAYVMRAYERLSEASRARTFVAAGVWNLDEFIAALGLMDCFVTNDTGPLHLAAAQGTPLVSLWGPSRPESWAPRGERHEMLYDEYPCSPCIHMFTTYEGMWCHHEGWCMQAIAPAPVFAAVERVLAMGPRERVTPVVAPDAVPPTRPVPASGA